MSSQVYELGGQGFVSIPNPVIISPRDPVNTSASAPGDTIHPNGAAYQPGNGWRNTTTGNFFEYAGGGVWFLLSEPAGGPIETLTGNSGGAIHPTLGNINILGNSQATFVGSGSTLTLTQTAAGYPITPYVVGPVGQAGYQTVQAAVTAIGAGSGLIWVQPGTYTESLTFTAGCDITIASGSPDLATITGVHTPPASGFVRFLEITLTSATHIFSSAAAGTAQLTIESTIATCTNGFTFNLANWTGPLQSFHGVHNGTANGFVTNSGGSTITVANSSLGNGTGQTMVTTGPIEVEASDILCPYSPTTGTVINFNWVRFTRTTTIGGSASGTFTNSSWSTGATAAITMSSSAAVNILNSSITSSNNPAIAGAGAGVLTLGGVDFTSNTAIAGTLTLGTADNLKAGSITSLSTVVSTTSMTATLGDITATNGNFVGSASGKGILLNSPAASGASPGPVVVNGRSGQATFTGVSIAAAADLTLTITNSSVTASTTQVLYSMSGATTGSALSIKSITNSAGSSAIVVTNGTGATTSTANIVFNFLVLNT